MELVRVTSSNLQDVGYDKRTKTLRVLFLEGATYDYFNVPVSVHRSLMKSESKGQFFQEHVVGQFRYEKSNLREEGHIMGQNKAQREAAERAAKPAATTVQPAAESKPAPQPAPATPTAQPTKQEATIAKLREGWTAKGVDLSKLTIKDDGKFKLLIVDAEWPMVQVGPTGGISLLELRS